MLTKLLSTSLLICSLLIPTVGLAQETDKRELDKLDKVEEVYKPYRLPQGLRVSLFGKTYQAYALDEYKVLLNMDFDLRVCNKDLDYLKNSYSLADKANESLTLAIAEADEQVVVLREDRDRLHMKWEKENKKRHIAENKPTFGTWVPWTVAGISLALTAGIFIAVVAGG